MAAKLRRLRLVQDSPTRAKSINLRPVVSNHGESIAVN